MESDREILGRALSLRASLDFGELSRQHWKCVGNADRDFALHKRSSTHTKREESTRHEVLCSGSIAASVEELAAVLHATTNKDFEAQMRALYDKDFIFGTIEKTVTTEGDQVLGGGGGGGDVDNANPQPQPHVAVKTASFVAPDVFAKNEQWCFLELFLRDRSEGAVVGTSGFTLARSSLQPAERTKGKLPPTRVRQLHGLTMCYFVERLVVADRRKGARVHFYGSAGNADLDGNITGNFSSKRAYARLNMLAKGVAYLPALVRSRRLGVQVLADRDAFDVKNARCTCCTRRLLPLVTKKTRCYLCGYYVCESCSAREHMETQNGHRATIIVCKRCMHGVNACDYSNLGPDASRPPPHVVPDPPQPSAAQRESGKCFSVRASLREKKLSGSSLASNGSSSEDQTTTNLTSMPSSCSCHSMASLSPACQMLIDQLRAMKNGASTNSRRAAVVTLLQYLVDLPVISLNDETGYTDEVIASLVKKALDVTGCPPDVDACTLANATGRPFPSLVATTTGRSSENLCPLPHDEPQRLANIARLRVESMKDMPELNAICALAAAETQCAHSVVTLVGETQLRVLAANAQSSWEVGCRLDRGQTFCQHLVLSSAPLLIQNAEADVRFYAVDPVTQNCVSFYLGFPVRTTDGSVFGALCCLDDSPRVITRSQYWRLAKLADAASRVLQARCAAAAAISEAFPSTVSAAAAAAAATAGALCA